MSNQNRMIETTRNSGEAESYFLNEFDLIVKNAARGTAWTEHRHQAVKAFANLGFPTKRTESYKYTPITRRVKSTLSNAVESEMRTSNRAFGDVSGIHLDTNNGLLTNGPPASSLPKGLTVTTLQEDAKSENGVLHKHLSSAIVLDRDPFSALAAALTEDGILIHVAVGAHIEQPIVIHHDRIAAAGFVQSRFLIVADAGSTLRIIEHFGHLDAGSAFENRVTEIIVGEGANLDHVLVYERSEEATFVNALFVEQGEGSIFKTNNITIGGGVVRNNLNFLPNAENCETHLNGLYIARGASHVDNHTLVDHAKPNCYSNELFKGIVADTATGVFNGKVLVRQDAQKTNAYQSSKSILLDRRARIFAKPELVIYADDVKCSHGATTGELDDEALFYLRSRGLRPDAARLLLLEAFARDVIDLVEVEDMREYLYDRLHQLLTNE